MFFEVITLNNEQCKNCQHYLRHYTLDNRKIFRVYCGHCTFPRARHKRQDAKACENFVPGTAQEDAFVSKEYLSKELLQYLLNLELLPKIEDKA